MLAKRVVEEFGENATFAEEDFGESDLSKDQGFVRYPAVFVDGELFAGPFDFFDWGKDEPGKYSPLYDTDQRKRFRDDLRTAIEKHLASKRAAKSKSAPVEPEAPADRVTVSDADRPEAAAAVAEYLESLRSMLPIDGVDQASYEARFERYDRALARGHWLAVLDSLASVGPTFAAYAARARHADIGTADVKEFDELCDEAGERLEHGLVELQSDGSAYANAAVQALAEHAAFTARPYLASSRMFARAMTNADGLVYLGKAQGEVRFAQACRWMRSGEPAPAPEGLAAHLRRLEQRVMTDFDAAGPATTDEPTFVRVNALLKVAREMLDRKLERGAWLCMLDAHFDLAFVQRSAQPAPRAAAVKALAQKWQRSLDGSAIDASIAKMYWQNAMLRLERNDAAAHDVLRAWTLLRDVLPQCRY